MNTDIVAEYVRRLDEALRDADAFPAVLAALESDHSIHKPELSEIARQFYGSAPAKASRKECLRLISERHRSLMRFRSKSRSQDGKSAA